MIGRKDDDAAERFGYRLIEIRADLAHHGASEKHAEFGYRCATSSFDRFSDGYADRHRQRDRIRDGSGDGEVLVGHRLIEADIHQRLDVHNDAANIFGQATGRDDALRNVVDHHEFVAGGVGIDQRKDANVGRKFGLQGVHHAVIFVLDADDSFGAAGQFHRDADATQHVVGVVHQQLFIFV